MISRIFLFFEGKSNLFIDVYEDRGDIRLTQNLKKLGN